MLNGKNAENEKINKDRNFTNNKDFNKNDQNIKDQKIKNTEKPLEKSIEKIIEQTPEEIKITKLNEEFKTLKKKIINKRKEKIKQKYKKK